MISVQVAIRKKSCLPPPLLDSKAYTVIVVSSSSILLSVARGIEMKAFFQMKKKEK